MIEAPDYLPLGSVVTLKGNAKAMMVVARALVVNEEQGGQAYYDYGLCLYPEGLIGDAVVYSNHDCVDDVIFQGFRDEEDAKLMATIAEALPNLEVKKASPSPVSTW